MGDRERVTPDEMKREREAGIGEGGQRKWKASVGGEMKNNGRGERVNG